MCVLSDCAVRIKPVVVLATIIEQKGVNNLKMPINGLGFLAYKSDWLRDHFLLVARLDHTTGSRNIKPEVVFKVQKMARYASFCLIIGPFKGEVPVFARLWPVRPPWRAPRRRLTLAVRSDILATAGLLVCLDKINLSYRLFVHITINANQANLLHLLCQTITDASCINRTRVG